MTAKHNTPRTDLALDTKEIIEKTSTKVKGIKEKNFNINGIEVNEMIVEGVAAKELGKQPGNYMTITTTSVIEQDTMKQTEAVEVVASQLQKMLSYQQMEQDSKGLVIGLGNWQITPDALGPLTVEKVLVTNHLFQLEDETVHEGYRPVAAMSPGVMGVTGLETSDIVSSIVQQFSPAFLIVIDALATSAVERMNKTIQITDTGIHPGSGVGNKRKALNKEVLGIPVIAIGVPTVVDAVTIVSDSIDLLLQYIGREWQEKEMPKQSLLPSMLARQHQNLSASDIPDEAVAKQFLGLLGSLTKDEKTTLLYEVLSPAGKNAIVTAKEVDGYMEDMAHLLASSINSALHDAVDIRENYFTR